MEGYVDLYMVPLPKSNTDAYVNLATRFGKLTLKHGALRYRELIGDDLFVPDTLSFTQVAKIGGDEELTIAIVDFKSRQHRDEVMDAMFKDEEMARMMQESPLTDMSKMYYGGFKTFVEA